MSRASRPAVFLALALLAAPGWTADPETLELEAGAMGFAVTALSGPELEEIPLRYIGIYRDFAGPGRDLHLVELEGEDAERVGVAAGMSGSPVYIDGKLIGALSYRLGLLPKQAIAGVTPLADMLDSARAEPVGPAGGASGMAPIATPVLTSGMAPGVREWLTPHMEEHGLLLVPGGQVSGDSGSDGDATELQPGSPVAVELIRGDLRLAATGTVTWVDGDTVYAFGHPFLGAGRVSLPMAAAEVIHTLADMAGSTKMASVGRELGVFFDDRLAAVVGQLGRQAQMIPVSLRVHGGDYDTRTYEYRVADQSRMTPVLAATAVVNSLRSNLGYTDESTMLARGVVRLRDHPEFPIEMAFAGRGPTDPSFAVASDVFLMLAQLWGNPHDTPVVERIDMEVDIRPEIVRYEVESVHYDRGRLRPGQTLELTCVLQRYRGERIRRTVEVELPETLPDGRLLLAVGSPRGVDRALGGPLYQRTRSATDLGSVIRALQDRRSANRLTAVVYRSAGGVVARGQSYSNLPPTIERLLATQAGSSRRTGQATPLGRVEIEMDGPIRGSVVTRLRVERLPETGENR